MQPPTFICVFVQQSFYAVNASCTATEDLFIKPSLFNGVFFLDRRGQSRSAADAEALVIIGSKSAFRTNFHLRLSEVSLEETLEAGAVSGFVLCHLMNGVVDRVEIGCFRALGKV